jgi:hypothetical protein
MKPRRLIFCLALIAAIALNANPWFEPHIIFGNGSTMPGLAIALLMPLVMAIAGPPFPDRRLRVAAGIALWLIAIVGMLGATAILFWENSGAYKLRRTVSTGRYTLAVVTRDFGAMDEGSTDIDQVCRIVPGVMLASHLRHTAGIDTPNITFLARDRVMIDGWIYDLRPVLWPVC